MPKVTRIDAVVCHQCGQSSHQLTDNYDQNKPIDGTMVTLREPYKSYGWESHPEDPGCFEGDIQCAFCDAPLAPSNVIIAEEVYVDENGARFDDSVDGEPVEKTRPRPAEIEKDRDTIKEVRAKNMKSKKRKKKKTV